MRTRLLAALLLATARLAVAQTCPSCIQNSAAPQNAQMNIGTATIRGTLSAHVLNTDVFSASAISAATLAGDGSTITNLNAGNLASGVVAAARLVGAYTGITSVGTLTAGIWHGTPVGTQYGGTGQNWSAKSAGSLPYFLTTGVMDTLAPGSAGQMLQSNGALPPTWTSAPQIDGTNVTGIPMANLIPGALPGTITVPDASLTTVSAARVVGDIPGKADNINGVLALGQLGAGTLSTANPASSVTASGVIPGIYGGPSLLPQITVGYDGRITGAVQSTFTVPLANLAPGTLPSGILVPAGNVQPGVLGASVQASSLNATGASPGSYGSPSSTLEAVVRGDGRLTSLANVPIAIGLSQIAPGSLPGSITVPASSIEPGALPGNVIASSLNATGIIPSTYGSPTQTLQLVLGSDGRVTGVTALAIPGVSTFAAVTTTQDNNWQHAQTSQSSWTIKADLGVNGVATLGWLSVTHDGAIGNNLTVVSTVTAGHFIGNGDGLTNISTSSLTGPLVKLLSATTNFVVTNPSGVGAATLDLGNTGVTPGTYGSSSLIPIITADVHGRITSASTTSLTPSACTATGVPSLVCNKPGGTNASNAIDGVVSGGNANTATVGADDGVIAGGVSNTLSGAATGGTISGGSSNSGQAPNVTIGGGNANTASGNAATAGGGQSNQATANWATVPGGKQNVAAGQSSTAGGGIQNHANGLAATVAGGSSNTASDASASVGGGSNNTAAGQYATIPGGFSNATNGSKATVGGGESNVAGNDDATVGGGVSNSATGLYSTVPGGDSNRVSGSWSIAQGRRAVNVDTGAYVSADSTNADYPSHGQNTYNIRYNGGIFFDSTSPLWISTGDLNVAQGNIIATSSVTAGAFFGDISHATGFPTQTCHGGGGAFSVVCDGSGNTTSATGATIGGGTGNDVEDNYGTVSGGQNNNANFHYAAVGGGQNNHADGYHGFIGSGLNNLLNNGQSSVIGGGSSNEVDGDYASILGGQSCYAAANYSQAGGRRAKALDVGSYVQTDSQNSDYNDHGNDTWSTRYAGGYWLDMSAISSVTIPLGSLNLQAGAVTAQSFNAVASEYKVDGVPFIAAGSNLSVSSVSASGDVNTKGLYKVNGAQIASTNLSDSASLIQTTTALGGDFSGFLPNGVVTQMQGGQVTATSGGVLTTQNAINILGGHPLRLHPETSGQFASLNFSDDLKVHLNYPLDLSVNTGGNALVTDFGYIDSMPGYKINGTVVFDSGHNLLSIGNITGGGDITMGTISVNMVTAATGTFTDVFTGSATVSGNVSVGGNISVTTATVSGTLHAGWEHITNPCGPAMTTCTATCSAGNVATGGGCDASGVAITTSNGDSGSFICNSLVATTLTASVYCMRVGN